MTPLELAEKVIRDWSSCNGGQFPQLGKLIHAAIIEATNDEVEKRRAAEAEVSRLQRIIERISTTEAPVQVTVDASEKHLRLRIQNPVTGEWWTIAATSEQPHLQGEVQRGKD